MKKILFCVFAASALILSSCSEENGNINDVIADVEENSNGNTEENGNENIGQVTFIAEAESRAGSSSRTVVDINGNEGVIKWTSNDQISVLNSGNTFDTFSLYSGANTATATFSGDFTEGTSAGDIAIYPAGSHSYDGTTLTVNLPASYGDENTEYTPNASVPMIAEVDVNAKKLYFKHLCGVIYIDVEVPAGITSLSFTAKGLCGDFTVDMSGENAVINQDADATDQTVTYYFKAFETTKTERFYFPAPIGSYQNCKIYVTDNNAEAEKTILEGNARSLGRARIAKAAELTDIKLWVDMGFDSGTLWATKNVGANVESDYGYYFAWGEVKEKEIYSWNNYKWCVDGSYSNLTKYVRSANSANGYNSFTDSKVTLDAEDDAAIAYWGDEWKMPTHAMQEELKSNVSKTHTDNYKGSGVAGMILTSKKSGYTDRSIFFPYTGHYTDEGTGVLAEVGTIFYCWSSSLPSNGIGKSTQASYIYG